MSDASDEQRSRDLELLLEANPEAVLEPDRDGVTPLALVWVRQAQPAFIFPQILPPEASHRHVRATLKEFQAPLPGACQSSHDRWQRQWAAR